MQYKYTSPDNTSVVDTESGKSFPCDPRNPHWQAIVASGAAILPADPEPPATFVAPATPPVLTGSWADGSAVQNLAQLLADQGIIINGTTGGK